MTYCTSTTYRGPGGTFTAHKRVNGFTGWVTGKDGQSEARYIGGRGSYADALELARELSERTR